MSDMQIINPIVLTDAKVYSSTIAEPAAGETVFASGTFAVNDVRIVVATHRKYKCKVAGAHATSPELDPTNWTDIGPTMKWAMFDYKVGTVSTIASPLTVVLKPGSVSGIGFLGLVGRQLSITMKDAPGGTVVYTKTVILDATIIESVYDWFVEDYEQRADLAITDLPQHFPNCELTISITATSGNCSCGVLQVGKVTTVGKVLSNLALGFRIRSIKKEDDFGNMYIAKRPSSKRNSYKVKIDERRLNKIYRLLNELQDIACIFVGSQSGYFEPLVAYGFFKDATVDVNYTTSQIVNFEIEGLA